MNPVNPNIIQGTGNKIESDILANARNAGNICEPTRDIQEQVNEQIARAIGKPIYEFVGALSDKEEFIRYTRLIRRNK